MGKSYTIPFNSKTGSQLSYVGFPADREGVTWVDNFEFQAKLRVVSCYKGRSAINFTLQEVNGPKQYTMFLSDLQNLLTDQQATIVDGVIDGTWTFRKQGSNYGIKLAFQHKYAQLHHPTVPQQIWEQWLDKSDDSWRMLLTVCCNSTFREMFEFGGTGYEDWRCCGCGAKIDPKYRQRVFDAMRKAGRLT